MKNKKVQPTPTEAQMRWRCHTPSLLAEIVNNTHGGAALRAPLAILGQLLADVARRAIELNDPELNQLMCRLTLYSIADPYDPDYNREKVNEILAQDFGK